MTTGHSKMCTEAPMNVLETDRRPSASDVLRQFSTSLDLESDDNSSVENVKEHFSYSSAQEWIHTHNSDIIVALRLLQIYPKLIRSNIARPLLKLLNPLLLRPPQNSPNEYPPEPVSAWPKLVYVCGHSEFVSDGITAKDRIISSLASYCRVQTHPTPPPQEDSVQDALEDVKSSDVFIFLLNDDTVNCWYSLYRLAGAVAFNIPVITIRDSSFELSDPLPESVYQTEILTNHNVGVGLHLDVANDDVQVRLASSRSSGFHSACSQTKSDSGEQISPNRCLLSDVIKNCHLSSMRYVSKFHDSCVAKLFGKLSDYLGDFFLDLEISNHFERFTPDTEADSKASIYFSKTAILRKRLSTPPHRHRDQTIENNDDINTDSRTTYLETEASVNSKMEKNDKRYTDCESPFVHRTTYVVFPSRSPSSSRRSPYVVTFPDGMESVEKDESDNVSPYGDFDNVPLDISVPFKDSPPSTPITPEKCDEGAKEDKRDKDSKVAREPKMQKKEPKQCTVVRHSTTTNRKTVSRRTAKLPKINLQVHDVREMKNHSKSRRLDKSVSI